LVGELAAYAVRHAGPPIDYGSWVIGNRSTDAAAEVIGVQITGAFVNVKPVGNIVAVKGEGFVVDDNSCNRQD
jgi:hypothetical protein